MVNKLDKSKGGTVPCVYKWGWSTIKLMNGQTNSCHRTENSDITLDNFDSFHNTKQKIKARKTMNKGLWPGGGCEYCRDIENAGGISDRLDVTEQKNYDELVPTQNRITKNSNTVRTTPTMVEVYFTNVCNMSCIYCGPKYSSVWENEINSNPDDSSLDYYRITDMPYILSNKDQKALVEKFFNWLPKNSKNLTNLRILGGEPFFQAETYRTIEYLENSFHPNLSLTIFSNLKVPYSKFCQTIDRLNELQNSKKVSNITVVCSIDCWGPASEYMRTGLNLQSWEENFSYLAKSQFIESHIHGTMNSLSIHTLADLLKIRNYYQTDTNPIRYSSNILVGPDILDPGNWQEDWFKESFANSYNVMTSSEIQQHKGYEKRINQKPSIDNIKELTIDWLENFDKRRGTNWKNAFPWLLF
jgi:organic radical activating enzyme